MAKFKKDVLAPAKVVYFVCYDCGAPHRDYKPSKGCVRCGSSNLIEAGIRKRLPKGRSKPIDRFGNLLGVKSKCPVCSRPKPEDEQFCSSQCATDERNAVMALRKKGESGNGTAVKKAAAKKATTKKASAAESGGPCNCGCGEQVSKGRKFRPGHDARFHSVLRKLGDGRMVLKDVPDGMKPYVRKALKEGH